MKMHLIGAQKREEIDSSKRMKRTQDGKNNIKRAGELEIKK